MVRRIRTRHADSESHSDLSETRLVQSRIIHNIIHAGLKDRCSLAGLQVERGVVVPDVGVTSPSASFKREGRVRGSVVVLARVECANELRGTGQELLPTDEAVQIVL